MEEFKKPLMPMPTKADEPASETEAIKESTGDSKEENRDSGKVQAQQNCPYKVPLWSGTPHSNRNYSFEVLKSGQIIDEVKNLQNKPYWTFGRLPENDIEMAHPTISRFHAILQYKPMRNDTANAEDNSETENVEDDNNKGPPEGWYIYDLDSTHGTFLNKQRIPPKVYIRIKVGFILRLGASTRSYILQGPSEDEEPESELTVTELKAKRQRDLEEAALQKQRMAEEAEERERNEGCSWGMGDDADEETDLTHNPYASTNNEELFLDDPKKTLRGYFEREGLQLEYKCDEMSAGSFVCRVELPLDDDNGRPIIAEVVHKGKKKECVVQCALEACRILDRHGVLRQANQEPLKRKQKSKDSDSDDDEFWDRTGDVARKKQRKANASTSVTLTYEDLLKQEAELNRELDQIRNNILAYQEQQRSLKMQKEKELGDDLDSYMENLQNKETPMDKTEIKKLRLEELRIKTEIQRNQRLLKIAKPADLPFIKNPLEMNPQDLENKNEAKKKPMPMIGKRNQFSKFKLVKPLAAPSEKQIKPHHSLASDEEEIEEEDNDNVPESARPTSAKSGTKLNINEVFESATDAAAQDNKETTNEDKKVLDDSSLSPGITAKLSEENETSFDMEKPNDDTVNKTSKESSMEHISRYSLNETSESITARDTAKKRRQRNRQRGKREVDIDEDIEHESTEKYAKWVPPENQSGDGITELNEKYGY
ncbi:kanadaptin [Stomoxys calcitrans]|uniref:kanadaptin n=1 Tax=Stomoxys calcitrans TaxID=35570 RepID=UPI0027E37633|nr:kanadaptin [Stomoxys calcitrans]